MQAKAAAGSGSDFIKTMSEKMWRALVAACDVNPPVPDQAFERAAGKKRGAGHSPKSEPVVKYVRKD